MPLAVGSWAHLQLLRAGPAQGRGPAGPGVPAQAQLALLEVIMPPEAGLRPWPEPGPLRSDGQVLS
jgi:hypothetical protein